MVDESVGPMDPCVVHDDVEPTDGLDGSRDYLGRTRLGRNVLHRRHGMSARRDDPRGYIFGRTGDWMLARHIDTEVGDDHAGATGREELAITPPQSPSTPRDDRNPVIKSEQPVLLPAKFGARFHPWALHHAV
jgi:hypothetical protein